MTIAENKALQDVVEVLQRHTSRIIAEVIVEKSCIACNYRVGDARLMDPTRLLAQIEKRILIFMRDAAQRSNCLSEIAKLWEGQRTAKASADVETVREVKTDGDVVDVRLRARRLCADCGFSVTEQTKVATVVSELSRNIVMYGGGGKITLRTVSTPLLGIVVVAEDHGSGIADLDAILSGRRSSRTGMGLGLSGSKKLMDVFVVDTGPDRGTKITAAKYRS